MTEPKVGTDSRCCVFQVWDRQPCHADLVRQLVSREKLWRVAGSAHALPARGHRPRPAHTYIAMPNTRTASVVEATLMTTIAIMLSQMPPLTMLPMLT